VCCPLEEARPTLRWAPGALWEASSWEASLWPSSNMFRTFRDCCVDASASFLLLGLQRRHKQEEARPYNHTTRPPLLYAHLSICYTILKDLSGNSRIRSNLKVNGKSVAYFSYRPETIAKRNVTNCLNTVYSTINEADCT
jgi:hypothetical protein